MKKIKNIVFYQFFGSNDSEKKACIFYEDGTFSNVSFSEGIDACEIIVKEKNITTKDAFREMINKDLVHVVSGADFEKNFKNYFPKVEMADVERNNLVEEEPIIVEEPVSEEIDEDELKETANKIDQEIEEDNKSNGAIPVAAAAAAGVAAATAANKLNNHKKQEVSNDADDEIEEDIEEIAPEIEEVETEVKEEKEVEEEKKKDNTSSSNNAADDSMENEEIAEEGKKKGFFARMWDKIKNSKLIKRIAVCVTAIAVGLGLYSCAARKTKEGQMNNSNLTDINNDMNLDYTDLKDIDNYKGESFDKLQARNTNAFQKQAMANVDLALNSFNNTFAGAYLEEGKDIRAALKFEEVVALQTAYNDYTKEELRAYFNGSDINASELSRQYKDATLQLMGAHAIENREHPVDMSMLIDSKEGKDFYAKYHEAFLAAKEATGQDKIDKVNAFYSMVRKDFSLSEKERTEGISHAELHEIESYKLSVTPMVAAAEMLFQNLNVDVTLNDMEIDFFNNIGLCNIADSHFRRIETISLSGCECKDSKNPTYEEYRAALIHKYKQLGYYYIDDAHRELADLDRFKEAVNVHVQCGGWEYKGQTITTTETHTEVETHTETETKYHTEEERVEKPIPQDVKEKIDQEIEAENERARRQAEEDAEKVRREMQEKEDKHAKEVEEEVKRDEEQLQKDIEKANDRIDENNKDNDPKNDVPVNESDFGDAHVVFDEEHKDEHGNLDPSVQNITTDSTGDQTNEELPDPNKTGAEFDKHAPAAKEEVQVQSQPEEHHEKSAKEENPSTASEGWVESKPVEEGYSHESFWVEEEPVQSNAEAVDKYVESLAAETDAEEDSYQYTK